MNVRTLGIRRRGRPRCPPARRPSTTRTPRGPRYRGIHAGPPAPRERGLRVVTFNVKYARQSAGGRRQLLKTDPQLAGADVIALQEMDEAGTELIARTLGLNYVYYPAARAPRRARELRQRDPEPAGRWKTTSRSCSPTAGGCGSRCASRSAPPCASRGGSRSASTASTWRRPSASPGAAAATRRRRSSPTPRSHPRVIVAGDFNSRCDPRAGFATHGFRWLTRRIGPTISRFSWDHVAVKGFRLRDCASVGAVTNAGGRSATTARCGRTCCPTRSPCRGGARMPVVRSRA